MGYWSVHHIVALHFTKKSIWKCDKTKTNLWPTLSSLEWQMRWSKVFQSLIHHRKPKLEKTSTTKDDRSLLDYRCIPLRCRLLQKHALYCTLRICMQFWVQRSLNFYCKRTLKNLYCKKGGQTRIIKKWIIGVLEPPFLDQGIYVNVPSFFCCVIGSYQKVFYMILLNVFQTCFARKPVVFKWTFIHF